MMNAEIKKKWLTALRTGRLANRNKIRQGQEQLKARLGGQEHCCLGVLCAVSGVGQWKRLENSVCYVSTKDATDFESAWLPKSVLEMAEIGPEYKTPTITIPEEPRQLLSFLAEVMVKHKNPRKAIILEELQALTFNLRLVDLNDYGMTFPEIADVIEKYL